MKKPPRPPIEPGVEALEFARRKSAQDTYLDVKGRELPDPTPMQPPLGYKKTQSLTEQIRAMVISEKLRQEAESAGMETFEEADDFDIGDDFDPHSPYEEVFEGIPSPHSQAPFEGPVPEVVNPLYQPPSPQQNPLSGTGVPLRGPSAPLSTTPLAPSPGIPPEPAP